MTRSWIEKLPRGGGRLIAVLAAALLAFAAASLIPAERAQAQTVPLKYEIVVSVQSGEDNLGVVEFKDESGNNVQLGQGETRSVMVAENGQFDLQVKPSGTGQIDSIKLDGILRDVDSNQSDWISAFSSTIYPERSHRYDIAFSNRTAPFRGIPDALGEDGSFLVGMAYKVTGGPVYGAWKYDSDYIGLYDERKTDLSDGGVWIRALKPGTTTATYFEGNHKVRDKDVAITIGPNAPGEHYIFALAYANGKIDFAGNQKVKAGEQKTFTVMPDVGYRIDKLYVDGVEQQLTDAEKKGNHPYTFTNVQGNHDIVATFEEAAELTMVDSLQAYVGETVPNVKPNPNYGAWSYDDEYVDVVARGEGADRAFDITLKKAGSTTMTYVVNGMSKTIPVTIKPLPVITATSGPNGSIQPSGSVSVGVNTDKTFTMKPALTYMIDQVFVDGVDATAQLQGDAYTFKGVTADHEIHATFKKIVIGGLPSNQSLLMDESVSLTPTPAGGTWRIDDETILSLSEQGGVATFTGLKPGTTNATYTLNGVSKAVAFTVVLPPPRTITASAGANGSITPSGSVQVEYASDKTFTLVADQYFMIDKLLVDGVEATPQLQNKVYTYTFANVRSDHKIEVSFKPLAIGGLEDKELFVGESVSMTPTPGGGDWTFVDPTLLSLVEQNGVCTFTGLKAGSTKATYSVGGRSRDVTFTVRPVHTIVASAGTGGAISPSGDVPVKDDESQSFAVAPSPGYAIDQVLVDGAPVQLKNGTYEFENVKKGHTIEASFLEITGVEDRALFVGDSVSPTPSPAGGAWIVDDPAILSYDAQTNAFTGLKAGTTKATYSVGGGSRTATFEVKPVHTIVASAGAGGAIDPSGDVPVKDDESQSFAIEADPHYMIDKLLVDGAEVASQPLKAFYEFKHVREGHRIEARFKELVIGNLPSSQELVVGGTVVLDPTPTGGTWTIDDETVLTRLDQGSVLSLGRRSTAATFKALKPGTAKATYTVNGASRDVSFTVAPASFTIKAAAGAGGSIEPRGDVVVKRGADQEFAVTPDAGYRLERLLVDGEDAASRMRGSSFTFESVTADHAIEATFAPVAIPKPDDPAEPRPLVRTGDSALPAALLGAAALAAVVGAAAARRMLRR